MCVNVMEVSGAINFSSKTWVYSPERNKFNVLWTAGVGEISAPLRFDEDVHVLFRQEGGALGGRW